MVWTLLQNEAVYEKVKGASEMTGITASKLRVFLSADEYKAKKAALADQTKQPDGLKSGMKFPLPDSAGTEDDKALYIVAPVITSTQLPNEGESIFGSVVDSGFPCC